LILLLLPVKKAKTITFENAQACLSVFNGLPFRMAVVAARYDLKAIEDGWLLEFSMSSLLKRRSRSSNPRLACIQRDVPTGRKTHRSRF
jgi:hypothetical protein